MTIAEAEIATGTTVAVLLAWLAHHIGASIRIELRIVGDAMDPIMNMFVGRLVDTT